MISLSHVQHTTIIILCYYCVVLWVGKTLNVKQRIGTPLFACRLVELTTASIMEWMTDWLVTQMVNNKQLYRKRQPPLYQF